MKAVWALGLVLAAVSPAAWAQDWRPADAAHTLVIDTSKGRVIVELYPEIAPKAVERVLTLSQRGVYDGLQMWRVIPGFVAQADPGNVEGGRSDLPDLAPEFSFRFTPDMTTATVADTSAGRVGFIGALPVTANRRLGPDGKATAWVSYCPGVMGMGRGEALNSANAEIFFMLGASPSLDHDYTPVGQVLIGQDVLQALQAGTPAAHPDTITRVQVLATMPDAPQVEVMDTKGPAFAAKIAKVRAKKGADLSVCDVVVPAKIKAKP